MYIIQIVVDVYRMIRYEHMTYIWHQYVCHLMCNPLQTQLRSCPVTPLGVVPDFIISFHLYLLGNGMILLSSLCQEYLDPESLGTRHDEEKSIV